ncbi:MAG: SufS family cysteine desulfurase [Planctomycetaceae bacterium]|nr:SufS family cysteine desulfurase [Planctomycetaceae bacterium]
MADLSDDATWRTIRAEFPILDQTLRTGKKLVYLDTAATAQKPNRVVDCIRQCYERDNSNVHRGIHELGDRMTTLLEDAREQVRELLGAREVEEIVFTSGTTMSLNLVAHGWGRKFLRAGDVVLLNEMEHHANLVPWYEAAKATGAEIRHIPLTTDGRLDMDQLDTVLDRQVKLVAVTAMSNVLGTINPVAELARRAHDVGALIAVDGAQSVPHGMTDVTRDQIDFLAFSGHKFYGPTGVGVLYGRRELLEAMDPFLFGGHMIREVTRDSATWADLPAKFEAGTGPFIQAAGLGAAIAYIKQIGMEPIMAYEHELARYAGERLAEVPELTILGPAWPDRGAIFSFVVEGVHPHDLSDLLDRQGVAIRAGHHCTMPLHDRLGLAASARASLAFYNNREEVDSLVEAILAARRVFRR